MGRPLAGAAPGLTNRDRGRTTDKGRRRKTDALQEARRMSRLMPCSPGYSFCFILDIGENPQAAMEAIHLIRRLRGIGLHLTVLEDVDAEAANAADAIRGLVVVLVRNLMATPGTRSLLQKEPVREERRERDRAFSSRPPACLSCCCCCGCDR